MAVFFAPRWDHLDITCHICKTYKSKAYKNKMSSSMAPKTGTRKDLFVLFVVALKVRQGGPKCSFLVHQDVPNPGAIPRPPWTQRHEHRVPFSFQIGTNQ